ncbi:glycosyltransferase family 39 protein [Leptolyngbya sp. AN03gr2]|uniref:glycosyltransferase family 39 protein n=1 Tax=unclassified Leptolyngbya TaxID=2650499 RepID=UPI003D31AF3C
MSARTDWVYLLIISSLWISAIAVANPIGNFPLNDDWAYGWTVQQLLETGTYQLSDWTATNLLSQVIWGTLFCLPFGFSFTALRISALVLGLVGALSTYGLLRETKATPELSLFGALVVAFNPIYFVAAHSFNSDVPSFAFAIASLYFLIRALRTDSRLALVLGTLLSLVSVLNRQSGIVVLIGFGVAAIAKKGFNFRTVRFAFLPAFLGFTAQFAYSHWLKVTDNTPILYGLQIQSLQETFVQGNTLQTYVTNIGIMSVYLGLFLAPFLVIDFPVWLKSSSRRLVLLLMIGIGFMLVLHDQQMPLAGNILQTYNLGTQALKGYDSLNVQTQSAIGYFWKLMTIAGCVSAGMLISVLLAALLRSVRTANWLLVFALSVIALYWGAIAGLNLNYWFDRYLIFLIPVLILLVSEQALSRRLTAISLIFLIGFSGFSIAGSHDYLTWNRVRWQALNGLVQDKGISPEQINGGFEFNGWHFGNRLETCSSKYRIQPRPKVAAWADFDCLWATWIETGRKYSYTVSFVPQAGYEIEQQYFFRRWLPWKQEQLYVLRKN